MENKSTNITVKVTINAPVSKVWAFWNQPEHITKWCNASDDWHAPYAENDLRVGGKFLTKMEAKDGSFGFEFWGIYDEIKQNLLIASTMGDGRKLKVVFKESGESTKISETFDAENENPIEMQKAGWQAILNNFKQYSEKN